jgi:hypothetical protein
MSKNKVVEAAKALANELRLKKPSGYHVSYGHGATEEGTPLVVISFQYVGRLSFLWMFGPPWKRKKIDELNQDTYTHAGETYNVEIRVSSQGRFL